MLLLKRIIKLISYLLIVPILYTMLSLILSFIPVNNTSTSTKKDQVIYLTSNGIHLDIVIPKESIDTNFLNNLILNKNDGFISFGWGDENFYLNTSTWGDLTFSNGFNALFLKSSTLMHVTRHQSLNKHWVAIPIDSIQLETLNSFIENSFERDSANSFINKNESYSNNDHFYQAKGSYSCLKTCNTWINNAFKKTGLKASLWTPFDFALLRLYNSNDSI